MAEMLGNNTLGDCTTAAAFHIDGVMLGNAGSPITWTDAEAIAFYSATSGYVPGDPSTDQGADEQTVLNYWRTKGLLSDGSHKIAAWVAVNGNDLDECRTAIWLFSNLYFGIELPDKWLNPMPQTSGFVWDVAGAPDADNGHAFNACGYDGQRFKIATWAMTGWLTNAAVSAYATTAGQGELYTCVSQDWIIKATQMAPPGFDITQLLADLQAIAY
ncbi:MAG: hypothetical protein WCA63_00805 [Gallionella sp.]